MGAGRAWALGICCGLMLLAGPAAFAVDAFGEGSAVISNGDVAAAKAQAVKAALAEAAAKHGAFLSAEQEMDGQQLKSERIKLNAQARILNYQVVDTSQSDGVIFVKVRADVEPAPARFAERRQHALRMGVTLEEVPISEDRFRLILSRMAGPFLSSGADGEMTQELRYYAEAMRLDGGYDSFVMESYKEYLRSGLLTRQRVAEAEFLFKRNR